MKAPLSKEIAKVLQNSKSADNLIRDVITARRSSSGVISVKVGGAVYRQAGSSHLQTKK